jgi:hypothetical protein
VRVTNIALQLTHVHVYVYHLTLMFNWKVTSCIIYSFFCYFNKNV